MAKKKHKKSKNGKRRWEQQMAAWNAAYPPPAGAGQGAGLFGGLARLLPSRRSDQFLLGAVIGAAAAYVLADEELRGKLMKSGLKLYAGLAGGLEEMKEQAADLKAELDAEQNAPS